MMSRHAIRSISRRRHCRSRRWASAALDADAAFRSYSRFAPRAAAAASRLTHDNASGS
jgi:hypothetical protein